jgi:transcriptional antiterminator RfaH
MPITEFAAMPILPSEPNQFPESLFADAGPGLPGEHQWWVLHTKPRQEKSLARHMLEKQIPFYLPLLAQRVRMRNRVLTSHVPLFASYVFLLGTREERVAALATNRVVHSLEVKDQEELWQDLRQVSRLLASGAPVTPEDRLAPGDMVEIKSGPLAGLRGKILRTASGQRFAVQVNFIQRGASVLMEDFNLKNINEEFQATNSD